MNQETTNKLVGSELHGFEPLMVSGPIILPLKSDGLVVIAGNLTILDGNPMGIAGQVFKHGFGPGEWSLGIDCQ